MMLFDNSVIPGIRMLATNDKKSTFRAETDAEGNYLLKLPVGFYSIEVGERRNLFCPVRMTNDTIVDSQVEMALDVVLARGLASHASNKCKTKVVKF